MKPVRPDMKQPATKATVRHVPDCANDRASVVSPSTVFFTAVDVRNTTTASGIRMMAIVLNCRFRYASAPSWIALAISFIFGVPSSSASTFRIKKNPTAIARSAVSAEPMRMAHSPPLSSKIWIAAFGGQD